MDDLSRQVIGGYEIRQRIGRGGFGAVYRAYQPAIDREVAIKIILSEYANKPSFIRNFEIEAQLVARLEHPFIVPLFDFWRDSRGAYIVMRLLRGGSLLETLKNDGAWKIDAASRVLDQIAAALTVAHNNGIIHQDIKAANILLDEQGNAYLTDFGIAKDTRQESPEAQIVSPTGELYGSPEYMAPEQILRSVVDERADIYSLGIVVFEMLTAQKPFANPDDEQLVRDQLYKPLPPIHTINPDLPEGLNDVIQRATDKHPRRRYASAMDFADSFRKFVTQSAPELIGSKPGATVEPVNPYKGLRAFQEADFADFFGREALTEQLFRRSNEGRFLAVIGASGSGKSSLVRAGLMPLLRRSNPNRFLMTMTPGAHPMTELESVLTKASLQEKISAADLRQPHGLHDALKKALGNFVNEMVLAIDQFEEVFTLVEDEAERKLFIDSLIHAVNAEDSRLRLIITIRADFFDRPLQYPGLNDLLRTRTEVVIPMTATEIERAVIKPAERVGLKVEDALVKAIVNEVSNQPGTLPLLQYALMELFTKRSGTTLTAKSYFDTGGVSGALIRRADEIYEGLDEDGKNVARQLFLRLVALGDGTEDTRRRALLPELLSLEGRKQTMQHIVDQFGKFRLLSFDHDPQSRAPTVDIAHEALIRNWKRLREWLNESRDELRLQRQLATATTQWKDAKQDASYLAQGGRLEQLETVLNSKVVAASADEKAFLDASIRRRTSRQRRRNMVIAGLVVIALVMAGLAMFSVDRERRAQEARELAETARRQADIARLMSLSRELAVTGLVGINQLDTALLLSVEALRAAETFEARNTLLTVVESAQTIPTQFERFLPGHQDAVRTVALHGDTLATGGRDGSVFLWNVTTGEGQVAIQHPDWVNTVEFSPDGKTVASAGRDHQILVWDGESHAVMHTLTGGDEIWDVAFSPDGQWLASAGGDGLYLWNLQTGESESLSSDAFYSAAWHSEVLAAGTRDGQITLWDVPTREPLQTIEAHSGGVWALRFSADGRFLASGAEDFKIKLWMVETGDLAVEMLEHTDVVRDLTFHSSGRYLISGSDDATIRIWDITTGQRTGGFQSINGGKVRGIALTADDGRLIAATDLNTALVWTFQGRNRLATLMPGHTQPVTNVTFHDDQIISFANDVSNQELLSQVRMGETLVELPEDRPRLVTASVLNDDSLITADTEGHIRWSSMTTGDTTEEITGGVAFFSLAVDDQTLAAGGVGDVHLWSRVDGTWTPQEQVLTAHNGRVFTLALSPDGLRLASGGADNIVRIWTLESGEVITLTGHTTPVITLTFSPDGRLLASSDRDNHILIWDTETGTLLQTLSSHLNWVMSLAFSPDGRLLASGSRDSTVILWDFSEFPYRQIGKPLVGHVDEVNSVAFNADGTQLVSGGKDGAVMVWQVSLDSWVQTACRIANRNLTESEWRQYLRDLPYNTTCGN